MELAAGVVGVSFWYRLSQAALAPEGVRVHSLAVSKLPRSGKGAELLAYCGIDAAAIVGKVRQIAG